MLVEMALETRFTRADLGLLPEGFRVELVDGVLLKMASPVIRHQRLLMRLLGRLSDSVGEERILPGPVDFVIDDYNVLVPDAVLLAPGMEPERGATDLAQALAVFEVLSPSTAKRDRQVKTQLYLDAGVQEVWLIDPQGSVDVRRSEAVEALPGFTLGDGFFRE